eukprot:Nitzschia sp. Nitz4//scaffold136_size62208//17635//18180//NITZ4_006363-RA/size62208-processed-gene-0.32-mRNA-1//-1//CDS//3329535603//396//frame0
MCSMVLRNDHEVVKAAATLDGMNMRHVALDLMLDMNEELIRLASRSNGKALEFCPPGPILQRILNDRAFVMDILTHTPQSVGIIWDSAPEALLEDLEFIKLAKKSEVENLKQDVDQDPNSYLDMDISLQQNNDITCQAIISPLSNSVVQARALQHFQISQRRIVPSRSACVEGFTHSSSSI